MSTEPVLVGVGMMTSVGLSAAETAASVRATVMAFIETPLKDHHLEPFTLAEVPKAGLAELHESLAGLAARDARLVQLAGPALAECLAPLRDHGVRPAVFLALPETDAPPLDAIAFLEWLGVQTHGAFDRARSDASSIGRAGGLLAIGRAIAAVQSGHVNFAVAGGVDTYRDLERLAALDAQGRVKSSANLDGFIPGEGAGFLLVGSEPAARRIGIPVLARLSAPAQGFETGHLYSAAPYRGDGLAGVVRELVDSGVVQAPFREVYSSMNGESHWAKEWGVSVIRNAAVFDPTYRIHHPADSFGDTGAAAGPIMVGLAALGLAGGYRAWPSLIYCSSDRGERAALTLGAA